MSTEGPHDPSENKKPSASDQTVKNLIKKYLGAALSIFSDPVGAVKSTLKTLGEESK